MTARVNGFVILHGVVLESETDIMDSVIDFVHSFRVEETFHQYFDGIR